MARYWKESLDIRFWRKMHGYKKRTYEGQIIDNLVCPKAYFIEVCGFVFCFYNEDEIDEYIRYFSKKIHKSTRHGFSGTEDHYDAQTKFTRLPGIIKSGRKRPIVLKALKHGINAFFK